MYYFYKTVEQAGDYLHKTKSKEIAERYGVIAACDTLIEAQDKFVELIKNGTYINKRTGECVIKKREEGRTRPFKLKVRCIETGEVWESMTALAADLYRTKQAVSDAVKNGTPLGLDGYHYERVEL